MMVSLVYLYGSLGGECADIRAHMWAELLGVCRHKAHVWAESLPDNSEISRKNKCEEVQNHNHRATARRGPDNHLAGPASRLHRWTPSFRLHLPCHGTAVGLSVLTSLCASVSSLREGNHNVVVRIKLASVREAFKMALGAL